MTYAIVNEGPAPISRYLPAAPDELARFFDQVLAKEPEERINSKGQVAELLDDVKESNDVLLQNRDLILEYFMQTKYLQI